jgi:AmmeMemoRadiSam system protein B
VQAWDLDPVEAGAVAAVAPHAGWAFSGRLAALAWSGLLPAETVVVIGGHLGPSAPILQAPEEGFETPFGIALADLGLREALLAELRGEGLSVEADRDVDNTVEVQLPFMGLFAPRSRLLWLRAPSGTDAIRLGECIHRAAASLGRTVAVLASTDLTHYGPDYSFEPRGSGSAALAWMRGVNDESFLAAVKALDAEAVLLRARADRSACSAGAVAAAIAFARERGAKRVLQHGYATSFDVREAPSFVGYAALGLY